MNTVKIGDEFENISYKLIKKSIQNGELGISESSAKVFQKKGYYSKDREKNIIFDLSIEIWTNNADKFSILYLIECKSTIKGNKVPVDDVEEFFTKTSQIAGSGIKPIMISNSSFQSGGLTFAKNKNIMLIEVDKENNHKVKLYRANSIITSKSEALDKIISTFLKKILSKNKISGLKKLNSEQIEEITKKILTDFNNYNPINIDFLIKYLNTTYNINFDFTKSLETINGNELMGYFDNEINTIFIDKSLIDKEQFPFILGHEIGHFFLHKNLKIDQELYNDFADSEYNYFLDKHILQNDRNWIEWQANKFSISLFVPKDLFYGNLILFRKNKGISKPHLIYLDEQIINIYDYNDTISFLSKKFGISKTVVKYRIEELGIITYGKPKKDIRDFI